MKDLMRHPVQISHCRINLVVAENNKSRWNWGIFYIEDYETDPFEFLVCSSD